MERDVNIKKILWASIEDYCGLWEIVWEINSLHPDLSSKESHQIAFRCVLKLVKENLVELFYCQEPYGHITKIIDKSSYLQLLEDIKQWASPTPGSRSIRVSATVDGKRYYDSMC